MYAIRSYYGVVAIEVGDRGGPEMGLGDLGRGEIPLAERVAEGIHHQRAVEPAAVGA